MNPRTWGVDYVCGSLRSVLTSLHNTHREDFGYCDCCRLILGLLGTQEVKHEKALYIVISKSTMDGILQGHLLGYFMEPPQTMTCFPQ